MSAYDYAYASLYTAPPQTSNVLDTKQRTHLVRSTRKLGAILGATPQVAEPEEYHPIPLSLRPSNSSSASTYSSSSSASASSSRAPTPDSSGPAYRPSRRHASVSAYPTRPSLSSSQPSPGVAQPPARSTSLTAALPKTPKPLRPGRSKSRPTNELPQPLVLHLAPAPRAINVAGAHSPERSGSRLRVPPTPRTPRTPVTPGSPTPTGTPAITPTTPVFPSATETRRRRMAKLTRTLGEIIPPHLVFGAKQSPRAAEPACAPQSAAPAGAQSEEDAALPPAKTAGSRQRRSMSVDFSGQEDPLAPFGRSSKVWVTGNQTWRGEWNRKDITEVQRKLRSLKAR